MLNNVSMTNISAIPAYKADDKTRPYRQNNKQNVSFGYQEESQNPLSAIKDFLVILTNDAVGLAGFNTVLAAMQRLVNGKVLIGKINNHFMKNITPDENNQILGLAKNMWEDKGLSAKGVNVNYGGPKGEAYFTHIGNKVVVGSDKYSALFHELGHAVEENCTKVFKQLQRFRGHYSDLSLALYFLMSLRPKSNDYQDKENQTFGDKVKNFFKNSDAVVPLIAFSPELITEGKASLEGLKFLKGKLKTGAISKSLYNNIAKSYATCFSTYLFVPISIMMLEALRRSASKAANRHNVKQSPYFY